MKENFNNLKKSIELLHDPVAIAIVDLLEEYNKGLSAYFSKREISREFLETFDIKLTFEAVLKKFTLTPSNELSLQQLALDLNTLARSTWYLELDGRILTGDDLYTRKAMYVASYKVQEPVYASKEDQAKAERLNDYVESLAYWDNDKDIPKPVGFQEKIVDIPGEEEASSIQEMVSLIQFHSMVLAQYLIKN